MQRDIATTEMTQYLSFFIGDEEYGLGILETREIIQYPTVTKVPSMPPAIRGVINLRGSVVPVIDLAVFFGYASRPASKWTCVVVVEADLGDERGHTLVGLIVDRVSQVFDLGANDVEPPPSFGTRVRRHYLRGMGKAGKTFVLLLALERLLGDVDVDQVASVPLEAEAEAAAAADGAASGPAEAQAQAAEAAEVAEPAAVDEESSSA